MSAVFAFRDSGKRYNARGRATAWVARTKPGTVSSSRESERRGAAAEEGAIPASSGVYLLLTLHFPAIALGLGTGIITPVLPGLAKSFDVGVGVATLVFIAQVAGSASGAIPTGYLIDRIGRRPVLLAGPVVTAIASFLVVFAGSFPELLVYLFIGGWGSQMWMLSRLTIVADTGEARQRGRQITSMHGVARIGTLLGPALGGLIAVVWGLRAPFILHGVIALLAVAPSFLVLRESAPDRTTTSGGPHGRGEQQPDTSWRALLAHPIPTVFAALFMANMARGGSALRGGSGPIFLYAAYAYGTGPATIGVLSSAMGIASIPVLFVAGFIMDRFGRKFTIVPALTLIGGSLLLVTATSYASLPFSAFVVAYVSLQLSTSLMGGSMQTLGSDIAPAHARGKFFGASRLVANSGSMSNPISFALLSQFAGFTAAFAFRSVIGFAAALVFVFFVKETLKKE